MKFPHDKEKRVKNQTIKINRLDIYQFKSGKLWKLRLLCRDRNPMSTSRYSKKVLCVEQHWNVHCNLCNAAISTHTGEVSCELILMKFYSWQSSVLKQAPFYVPASACNGINDWWSSKVHVRCVQINISINTCWPQEVCIQIWLDECAPKPTVVNTVHVK